MTSLLCDKNTANYLGKLNYDNAVRPVSFAIHSGPLVLITYLIVALLAVIR